LQRRFVKRLYQIREKLERGGTQEASQGETKPRSQKAHKEGTK